MSKSSNPKSDTALIPMRNVKQQVLGLELLRELASSGQRIFTLVDLRPYATELGLKDKDLDEAIDLLCEEGWIARIRRGIYAIVSSVPPSDPAHNFEIAMSLTDPAIISHWSALHYHGLVEEYPDATYVTTHTGSTIPRMKGSSHRGKYPVFELQERKFRFVQMKPERIFGVTTRNIHDCEIKISNPERALIEGLGSPHYCGGMQHVWLAFQARGGDLNLRRIIDYALTSDAATVKRLGWILETQHWNLKALQPLMDYQVRGFRKLDAQGPQSGAFNRTWMIRENFSIS